MRFLDFARNDKKIIIFAKNIHYELDEKHHRKSMGRQVAVGEK